MKFALPSENAASTVIETTTEHAVLRHTDLFEASTYEGADLVLAYRDELVGFRPNLVLTSVESSAPLTDASLAALLAPYQQHAGVLLYSCDLWHLDASEDVALARRIVFSYRADDTRDVLVHKWVWATGTHHVHLSASCLPSQAAAFAPSFSWIATHLRVRASADRVLAAARSMGDAPVDVDASRRAGYPLEDLSAVPSPAFVSSGPVVGVSALQTLLDGSARSRVGASRGVLARGERDSVAARQLTDAAWLDERARLTPEGGAAADILRTARHVVTVKLRRAGRSESLTAYAGHGRALLVHGAALPEAPLASEDLRHVSLVAGEHVPAVLAGWIGLRPFWSFSEQNERVSAADMEAHLAADSSGSLDPWTEVFVRDPSGERYDVMSPSRGFLRVGPPSDGVHPVDADPSGALFDHVLTLCDRAFSGV